MYYQDGRSILASRVRAGKLLFIESKRLEDGSFVTDLVSDDNTRIFQFVTRKTSEVRKALLAGGAVLEQSSGEQWSRIPAWFASCKNSYHPARPPGLSGFFPGEAGCDDSRGIKKRSSRAETGSDGSTIYRYRGRLADAAQGATAFVASEHLAADGSLLDTLVKYETPQNLTIHSGTAVVKRPVKVEGVTLAYTVRQTDGTYVTHMFSETGREHVFQTDARNPMHVALVLERVVRSKAN